MLDKGLDAGAQAADGRLAAHHRGEAVFQDERGIEVLHLQEPLRGLFQSQFGNQSDDLARNRQDAVTRGLPFHEFEDAVDRSLLEVGQVHRNLGHAAHEKSRCLDEA